MGLLGDIFGGGSKKQKPTKAEIAQATQAKKTDERFVSTFMPLEIAEIEQFMNPSAQKFQRSVLDRAVNADAAEAEQDSIRQAIRATQASGGNLSSGANVSAVTQGSIGAAVSEGLGDVEAASLAQRVRDEEGVGIIRTGRDVSRTTTNSLSSLARQEHFGAAAALRARATKSAARAKALGDVASAAIVRGARELDEANDPSIQDQDLGSIGGVIRRRQGNTTDAQTAGFHGAPLPPEARAPGFFDPNKAPSNSLRQI